MAIGYDLAVNLGAAAIGFGISEGKRWLLTRSSLRHRRTFWSGLSGRFVIVYPVHQNRLGESFPRNMARIEDIAATQIVSDAVESIGIPTDLRYDGEAIDGKADLILVCSPKSNQQSADLASRFRLPFEYQVFADKPSEIVSLESGVRYVTGPIQEGRKVDFALLGRVTDQAIGRKIYVIWGIRGAGTLGAAKFVADSAKVALVNRATKGSDFSLVLRIAYEDMREPEPGVPESQVVCFSAQTGSRAAVA